MLATTLSSINPDQYFCSVFNRRKLQSAFKMIFSKFLHQQTQSEKFYAINISMNTFFASSLWVSVCWFQRNIEKPRSSPLKFQKTKEELTCRTLLLCR